MRPSIGCFRRTSRSICRRAARRSRAKSSCRRRSPPPFNTWRTRRPRRAHRGREAGLAAARDAFYRGDIARAIVKFQKENGGILSAEDLANYRSGFDEPVETSFGDIKLYACGPWCQGPSLLQALNLLDGAELRKLGHNSAGYLHRITEAVKLAFADREAYFGDPRIVDVPIEALLSRDYARQAARDDPPGPGLARNAAGRRSAQACRRARAARRAAGAGARLLGAGARHLARLRHRPARQRVRGDAERRLLQRAGDPGARHHSVAARQPELGRPGSSVGRRARQAAAAHAEPGDRDRAGQDEDAVRHARRRRADPGDAAGLPQHPPVRHGGAGGGRSAARRVLQLSRPRSSRTPIIRACSIWRAGSTRPTGEALGRLGHKIGWWPDWTWLAGAVCTVVADQETGVLKGGADPRRPSYALGL